MAKSVLGHKGSGFRDRLAELAQKLESELSDENIRKIIDDGIVKDDDNARAYLIGYVRSGIQRIIKDLEKS